MCEITRFNFMDMYHTIENSINAADFISISTEFTGLYYDDSCKPSLFDNSGERYFKMLKSVQNFTVAQIGVTTFVRNAKENRYIAETYSFNICPLSLGSKDYRFCMQASSIQSLSKYKFDFNAWLYEGIPYLNKVQEKEMEMELENGLLLGGIERESDEKELQNVCAAVTVWLTTSSAGEFLTLNIPEELHSSLNLFHKDLRERFTQIWTFSSSSGQLIVKHVDRVKRLILEKQNREFGLQKEKSHLTEMLGFTRVFRLLQRSRKPVVGHDFLMDLMFLYEKFHQPLPDNYKVFKEDMNAIFPIIFDTKHINNCIQKPLKSMDIFKSGNLQDLYDVLHSEHIMNLILQQPAIALINARHNADEEQQHLPHHAGYDSYLCGCVFLRLCHLVHFQNVDSTDVAPCSFKMYLPSMKNYSNCVNVPRAMVNYINLAGIEPPVLRPPMIYVQAVKPGARLIPQQLALWFSLYGAVDIQMINTKQAIVATTNFIMECFTKQCKENRCSIDQVLSPLRRSQEIINAFKDHDAILVTKYSFLEHSILTQSFVLGSLAVATGTCLFILLNKFR